MKIIVPVSDSGALSLSEHFGRAPFYAWFEISGKIILERGVVPNTSDHFGGTGHPPDKILSLGADAIISMGMGMRAIETFQEAGVAVLKSTNVKTDEAIQLFIDDALPELTEGCLHSHDH